MDRGSMPWLLASEREYYDLSCIDVANHSDDRVKLPSDPTRTVKGVDVLPYVLSPLMGPEEYDMDVNHNKTNSGTRLMSNRKWTSCQLHYSSWVPTRRGNKIQS
jgi:hypothetical protein